MAEEPAHLRQVLARHDGLAIAAQVVQARPAGLRLGAERPPALDQAVGAAPFGESRKQEGVGVAGSGERGDVRPRGLAERHCARAGLRVGEIDGVLGDVAPAKIQHFAAPASGEREQPDRGDGLGPARFVRVERAPEPGQLVHVEEAGDMVARILRDAETGVGAGLAQSPLLGPVHHRAQYLEGAVGGAGPVAAGGVEPLSHVRRADAVERHFAERGQDVGLEVDAHGPPPRGLPVRVRAAQILGGERAQRRGLLLALDIVGGVPARTDAGAGAPAGAQRLRHGAARFGGGCRGGRCAGDGGLRVGREVCRVGY